MEKIIDSFYPQMPIAATRCPQEPHREGLGWLGKWGEEGHRQELLLWVSWEQADEAGSAERGLGILNKYSWFWVQGYL